MIIDAATLKSIDLIKSAAAALTRRLDHFPELIIDRCLANATNAVVGNISAVYAFGTAVPTETITMPRKGLGPRPIQITSASARTLYAALTAAISSAMPEPSRQPGNWDKHRRFGLEAGDNYLVDLDIASCYEYIDHKILETELILRSMDIPVCASLISYLDEVMERPQGLPQMLEASDRLADTYLSIIDRQLQRNRRESSRYVDDIRVIAPTWQEANIIIEEAAEYARMLGLSLSPEKTLVYKQATLVDQDHEDAEFYNAHFALARDYLTRYIFVGGGPYEESEEIEIEPEEKEAAQAAARDILHEWHNAFKGSDGHGISFGPRMRLINTCLAALQDAPERLPDDLLSDIVFEYPFKMEQVARYLISRKTEFLWEEHLKSISALIKMGRQSPWSKLWLLATIEILDSVSVERPPELTDWLQWQLLDRHEVVRAEAAWVCSMLGLLTSEVASGLYKRASPITQPAVAAAVFRQGALNEPLKRGIRDDAPLNREAVDWVEATTS